MCGNLLRADKNLVRDRLQEISVSAFRNENGELFERNVAEVEKQMKTAESDRV